RAQPGRDRRAHRHVRAGAAAGTAGQGPDRARQHLPQPAGRDARAARPGRHLAAASPVDGAGAAGRGRPAHGRAAGRRPGRCPAGGVVAAGPAVGRRPGRLLGDDPADGHVTVIVTVTVTVIVTVI